MHHVVIDVDLLDADVCKGHSEAYCAGPETLREGCQRKAVADDHQALNNENSGQYVPHVDHLLLKT